MVRVALFENWKSFSKIVSVFLFSVYSFLNSGKFLSNRKIKRYNVYIYIVFLTFDTIINVC